MAVLIVILAWSSLSQLAGDLSYLAAKRMFTMGHTTPALWVLTRLAGLQSQPSAAQATAGYILFTIGDLTGSEAQLHMHTDTLTPVEEMPEDITQREAEASRLNNLGMLRYRQGHLEEAINFQSQATAITVNSAIPHYNLGIMLWQSGDAISAIRALREATYIEPIWVAPYVYLALIALQQEQYNAAAQYAEHAIALAPELAVSYDLRMQALLAQQNGKAVLAFVDSSESHIISRDRWYLYQALALLISGESEQAHHLLGRLFIHSTDPKIRQRAMVELRAMAPL